MTTKKAEVSRKINNFSKKNLQYENPELADQMV